MFGADTPRTKHSDARIDSDGSPVGDHSGNMVDHESAAGQVVRTVSEHLPGELQRVGHHLSHVASVRSSIDGVDDRLPQGQFVHANPLLSSELL